MSLRTRRYREAEHRAALLDRAWERALSDVAEEADIKRVVRQYLREALAADMRLRLATPPGRPVYPGGWDGEQEPARHDLEGNTMGLILAEEALADRDFASVAHKVDGLIAMHRLPETVRPLLSLGVLQADVRMLREIEARITGKALDLVSEPPAHSPDAAVAEPAPPKPPRPLASALVESFLERRDKLDRQTHKQTAMERTTLRLFVEVCGDKPVDAYHRGDVTRFLDTLRRLPNTYGKSPKDKDRKLADIIAEADAAGKDRLTDRTAQRHLTALSQFFQAAVDGGHLTVAGRAELVDNHRFRDERGAREQRDAFTPAELAALFSSPVWRGRHRFFRDQAGSEVIRDGFFWLPILALYHGARLEELADLKRRDIGCDGGTWFLNITDEGGRRLKNGNARRIVPLHPEVVRLGFLEHVTKEAPQPDSPLFPKLPQRGADKRRGVDVTKWFTRYRRKFGLDRPGLSFHSFRHTAITRLTDAITNEQQRRHRDRMMGHGGGAGSEGDMRYDKGPGLKVMAETLALLRFPEIDLSPLYPARQDPTAERSPQAA